MLRVRINTKLLGVLSSGVTLIYWHYFQILIGVVFTLIIFESAYENEALTISKVYSRNICAVLLLSYSLAHLYILIFRGVYFHKVVAFLPLYLLFGFVYMTSSVGYIKSWAPSTQEEALQANFIYGLILLVILIGWLFSILYNSKYLPNKQINKD